MENKSDDQKRKQNKQFLSNGECCRQDATFAGKCSGDASQRVSNPKAATTCSSSGNGGGRADGRGTKWTSANGEEEKEIQKLALRRKKFIFSFVFFSHLTYRTKVHLLSPSPPSQLLHVVSDWHYTAHRGLPSPQISIPVWKLYSFHFFTFNQPINQQFSFWRNKVFALSTTSAKHKRGRWELPSPRHLPSFLALCKFEWEFWGERDLPSPRLIQFIVP